MSGDLKDRLKRLAEVALTSEPDVPLTLARQNSESARLILSVACDGNTGADAVLREVRPGDLPFPFGRYIESAARLHHAGVPVDPVSLAADLRASGDLESVGGARAIGELIDPEADPARLGLYIARLRETGARLRELERASDIMASAGAVVEFPSAGAVSSVLRLAGLDGLGDKPAPEVVEAALRALRSNLNGADPLRRATIREAAIKALDRVGVGAPARLVDAAIGTDSSKADAQGQAVALSDPEPWPDPVNGGALLNDLLESFTSHLVLPKGGAVALSLWTLHAHAHEASAVSPALAFKSATKRTGKTTGLTLLSALVPRPLLVSNVTPATIFRTVEAYRPTLLIDEADSFLTGKEELRGLLNSGHARAVAIILRTVGEEFEPRIFSTWCPKAIALIGDLPDTLEDRAIVLTMRRRAKGETVKPIRLDRLHEFEPLRRRAARWAQDNMEALKSADPKVPAELHDRAADNWRPLLAIADLCGGYADDARWSARILTGQDYEADTSNPVLLLADLRQLFHDRGTDRLSTESAVDALVALEERPWGRWGRGKGLSSNHLARLLRQFGIKSKQVWIGDANKRGFTAAMFADAWSRYLADPAPSLADEKPADASPKPAPGTVSSTLAPLASPTGVLEGVGQVAPSTEG